MSISSRAGGTAPADESQIPSGDQVKVLYIAGCGYSGSTILHNVLGQIEGFISVGELRVLGQGSLVQNRPCGCGVRFRECGFWNAVFEEAFGGMECVDTSTMARGSWLVRARFFPLLLPGGERILTSLLKEQLPNLEKVYRAIQTVSQGKVIVDESKSPVYARVLSLLPGIELYILHLIRDSRGVTYSSIKRNKWGPFRTAVYWNTVNPISESFRKRAPNRYMQLRYEDFAQHPRESVQKILEFVRESSAELPFVGANRVELRLTHTVGGNRNRFECGTIDLVLDETWKQKLSRLDQKITTFLTAPLLRRYGYLVRGEG